MCGEVIGCVPFYASDIGGCGDGWVSAGKMAFGVSRRGGDGGVGDYVYGVEEDPEDFFDDGIEFFVPDAVGSRMVD